MIAAAFEPGGLLASALREFERRPGQARMAEHVARTLDGGGTALIEAGTGTGKSLAYLLPAAMSGKKVVISTGTKALQDQLLRHDVPLVQASIDCEVEVAVVKGVGNYLCRRRFAEVGLLRSDDPHGLDAVRQWDELTITGDLAELDTVPRDSPLRSSITTTADGRLGPRCAYHTRCHVTRARRNADKADVIIVNHHLFFADLAVRQAGEGARVLPDYDAVIFDEAHLLETALTEHFTQSITTARWQRLLGDLVDLARRLGPSLGALHRPDRDLEGELAAAGDAWLLFDTAIKRELGGLAENGGNRLVLPEATFTREEVEQGWFSLDDHLRAVAERLFAHAHDREDDYGAEAFVMRRRVEEFRNSLAAIAEPDDRRHVRFAELGPRRLHLGAAPVDVGSIFAERVLGQDKPVILTSATLSCAGNFEHTRARLGISEDQADELALSSPFDYQNQALLYVASDLPDPRDELFGQASAERIAELCDITSGRTMVLFTSHKALKDVGARLHGTLAYPLLMQGQAAPAELLARFAEMTESVLLATGTFWQGIDVPGESLSQVIITKLPFAPPHDPLSSARARQTEEEGRDPFYDFQVPEAAITLRQGIGRLLRRSDDRGLISVLDRRLLAKRYGRQFLSSLPAELPRTAALERAKRWWNVA